MTEPIFPGRFTAQNSQEFVPFRIGMRFTAGAGCFRPCGPSLQCRPCSPNNRRIASSACFGRRRRFRGR